MRQTEKSGREIKDEMTRFLNSPQFKDILVIIYEIMKKRFVIYENELYLLYDYDFISQTDNDLEDFNNCLNMSIRKGQGRKVSWFYMKHKGESVAYYNNLLNAVNMAGACIFLGVLKRFLSSEFMS
ncbi:MAG: hypothetical protein ACFFAN_07895 [Promethearchaeota archaeon]